MATPRRASFIIGLVLTTLGSFLPWQSEGDFLSFWTYGIRIFPSVEDNGGLIVLFLSIALVALIFRPPNFIKKPKSWAVALSIVLTLDSIFHITSWAIDLSNKIGRVGAPSIQIGLIMVLLGSVILLITSLLHYRESLH